MKCFGDKKVLSVEYKLEDYNNGTFELWVENKEVCKIYKGEEQYFYNWDLSFIVEWIINNMENIMVDIFPLPVKANSSLEFYQESGDFDSEDDDEFDRWYDKRQDWYFKHSWYCNRQGSYLAEVLFRAVGNKIEIQWDNENTYDGIKFVNPKGIAYVDKNIFKSVFSSFIEDFLLEISKYEAGTVRLNELKYLYTLKSKISKNQNKLG